MPTKDLVINKIHCPIDLEKAIVSKLARYKFSKAEEDTTTTAEQFAQWIIEDVLFYLNWRARRLNDEDKIEFQIEQFIFKMIKEIDPNYEIRVRGF